jgi:hypothetical protein
VTASVIGTQSGTSPALHGTSRDIVGGGWEVAEVAKDTCIQSGCSRHAQVAPCRSIRGYALCDARGGRFITTKPDFSRYLTSRSAVIRAMESSAW